jgi:hypothetical protein
MVKYPNVKVKLTGQNGNAFMVLGLVSKALKKAGLPTDDFMKDAMSGDYDHLLATACDYVVVS